MKKNKMMMALILSTGLLFGACGSSETKEAATETTPAAEQVINTTHAYVCPMNCENSASNEPGLCKVCGMDPVKNTNYAGPADTTAVDVDSTTMAADQKMEEGHDHENHEGHNH